MILKISLREKGGVPKTLLEQKHRLNFLYFPQNTLMLTESREEFSDLHSIFRLRALRYSVCNHTSDNNIGRPRNHKTYKVREKKNNKVVKERKICVKILTREA